MKRTTIFLPDELHEQLRRDALRAKTSMAELIREKLRRATHRRPRRGAARDPILNVAGGCCGPILSEKIGDSLYGR
jgi:Arc/MetJ-type ribon-helix-helix transcriptional regulator